MHTCAMLALVASIKAILSLGNGVKYYFTMAASVSEATLRDSRIFGHGFSLDQDTFFV